MTYSEANKENELILGMSLFRKKPIVIQAIKWNKQVKHLTMVSEYDPYDEMIEGCGYCLYPFSDHGYVKTLEGGHIICPGDYLIRGVKGEFYPCKPDIFALTYDAIES